jgi:chloramphenicol-sensitive protein RarD
MSILSPIALIYLVVQVINGKSSFGSTTSLNHFLLVFSGVVTSMPLLWFAHGAQRIPLSTVGFIQYLVPSSHLFIGVVVFQEQFTLAHLLSFCLIWCAIIIYSLSHTPIFRKIESSLLSARRP